MAEDRKCLHYSLGDGVEHFVQVAGEGLSHRFGKFPRGVLKDLSKSRTDTSVGPKNLCKNVQTVRISIDADLRLLEQRVSRISQAKVTKRVFGAQEVFSIRARQATFHGNVPLLFRLS